jgi:copper homeostasis protein
MMSLVEICAGSLNSAIAAFEGGAQRIELCDNLYEGGTTPSYGYLKIARKEIPILLHVLIRPRGGDFCYNSVEFDMMKEDISFCKDLSMDGVVIGILSPDGTVDQERTAELVELSRPMSVTFHRAFDMTPDAMKALSSLKKIGVDRILTSGQKITTIEGAELIKQLIDEARDELVILPGGGLNVDNIKEFANFTQSKEYHATCRSTFESKMDYRNHEVTMGGLPQIPEFNIKETDPAKVVRFIEILNSI